MWLWGTAAVAISITGGMINYVLKRPAGLAPSDRGLRKVVRVVSEIALPTTLAATAGGELSLALSASISALTLSLSHSQLCSSTRSDALMAVTTRLLPSFVSIQLPSPPS